MSRLTDLAFFSDWAASRKWTFAKTMADSPHSYVVRGKCGPLDEYLEAVRVIRRWGEPGNFFAKTHIYLTIDDRKWWTMGSPMDRTKIINTADANKHYGKQVAPKTFTGIETPWDYKAETYDEEYAYEDETKAVRQALIEMVGLFGPSTLDIGCGTGRMLDLNVVPRALYTGVDYSQAMLNELVRKANWFKQRVPNIWPGPAERFTFAPAYDLGIASFGAASMVSESVIDQMAASCSNLLLMPVTGGPNAELCRSLDGAVVRSVGKFDLVTVKG